MKLKQWDVEIGKGGYAVVVLAESPNHAETKVLRMLKSGQLGNHEKGWKLSDVYALPLESAPVRPFRDVKYAKPGKPEWPREDPDYKEPARMEHWTDAEWSAYLASKK